MLALDTRKGTDHERYKSDRYRVTPRAIAFIPFARPGSPDPGPSHWIWQSSGSKKGFSVSQSLPDIINAIALVSPRVGALLTQVTETPDLETSL